MTAYLGNDCDGRPLYAGDRVVYVGGPRTRPERVGARGRLIKRETSEWILRHARALGHTGYVLRYEEDCGEIHAGDDDKFRKLDPPADWDEIARVTGWRPEREEETV